MKSEYGDYKCPSCKHVHEDIEYVPEGAGDRDAEYIIGVPVIDTITCQQSDCQEELCDECPRFVCSGCDQTFCEKHKVKAGELSYCVECSEQVFESVQKALADPVCMLCEAGATVLINEAGGLKPRESVWHSVGVGDGLMECPCWRDHVIDRQIKDLEALHKHCKTYRDKITQLEQELLNGE